MGNLGKLEGKNVLFRFLQVRAEGARKARLRVGTGNYFIAGFQAVTIMPLTGQEGVILREKNEAFRVVVVSRV